MFSPGTGSAVGPSYQRRLESGFPLRKAAPRQMRAGFNQRAVKHREAATMKQEKRQEEGGVDRGGPRPSIQEERVWEVWGCGGGGLSLAMAKLHVEGYCALFLARCSCALLSRRATVG